MKRSKILVCLMLALVLVVGMASSAMAAESYSFSFVPPISGEIERSNPAEVTGSTPYVDPSYGPQYTTYYLVYNSNMASNQVVSKLARETFTYKSNYGGNGMSMRMCGNPRYADFTTYKTYGSWQP
ncbi:MAG: hypothetical protein ACOYIH_11765 [Candidatus Fimadaptatus sp.]